MPTAQNLTLLLKKEAVLLGFDDIGIASVNGALPFVHEFAQAETKGYFGPLDYLYRTKQARMEVRSFFPDAASVAVVVKNYYTGNHPDGIGAKVARYAWGRDYHSWFKKRLRKLSDLLKQHGPENTRVWTFNDTGPFLERAWAQKAGLGFIGKSSLFIHRNMGTWTLLGGLATNQILSPDTPVEKQLCGNCTRCMDACPTQAIVEPGSVDARRCISTWTIERPLHPDSIHKAPRGHGWAFGCDVCQEVCPWNKFQITTADPFFQPFEKHRRLDLLSLPEQFQGSPLARAKRKGLLVNLWRSRGSTQSSSAER